jgi:hypothetical protein
MMWTYYIRTGWRDTRRASGTLLANVFIVAGIGLPVLLLLGLQKGLVQQFRSDLQKSPTARMIQARAFAGAKFGRTLASELEKPAQSATLDKRATEIELVIPEILTSDTLERADPPSRCAWMTGYDLRLMPSLNDVNDIPKTGKSQIIVAVANDVVQFRIFNGDGTMVVDTDQNKLEAPKKQIEEFKQQLKSVGPPHELTESEKSQLITAVTSIAGHTRLTLSTTKKGDPLLKFYNLDILEKNERGVIVSKPVADALGLKYHAVGDRLALDETPSPR